MPPSNQLIMSFDPNTIEHLGVRMYSTLPPVLAELIANSYDADAKKILLTLKDTDQDKEEIIVEDNGLGMTFDEINTKFLRIGRNRRLDEAAEKTPSGRLIIGKKGLGKLSFFGIAHEIEISTKKDGKENLFIMDWEAIKGSGDNEYTPQIVKENEPCDPNDHGTKITLRKLQRKSDFKPEDIANSLSKIFILDTDFTIAIQHNEQAPILVTNERKYVDLDKEIEWDIPKDIQLDSTYEKKDEVKGHLIATEKPISPKTNMRGITLFSRKKLVNQPEYFSESISSHFFSYLTGWLEVDFIDELEDDVIATNRQSLNWDNPEMMKLRQYLQEMIRWLEKDWRIKRAEIQQKAIKDTTGINVPEWYSKLPEEVRKKVQPVVDAIVKDAELAPEVRSSAVKNFHDIVPEYPKYHWRYLHVEIQSVSKTYYDNKDYYTAFLESVKHYINAVREKSGKSKAEISDDAPLMAGVFNMNSPVLSVTENFKKPNGTEFSEDTIKNVKNAQRLFSEGVVLGGRNVTAHEEFTDLRESGLFTEEDCLDALSLLSHLFHRLDNSTKMTTP
jgi:uncharacterized protein (TIGR02391 family)